MYGAATGKVLLTRNGSASPAITMPRQSSDGKVFIAALSGVVLVLKASDQLQILSRNDLGEAIGATPAIADDTLYVRSADHLWAFREIL